MVFVCRISIRFECFVGREAPPSPLFHPLRQPCMLSLHRVRSVGAHSPRGGIKTKAAPIMMMRMVALLFGVHCVGAHKTIDGRTVECWIHRVEVVAAAAGCGWAIGNASVVKCIGRQLVIPICSGGRIPRRSGSCGGAVVGKHDPVANGFECFLVLFLFGTISE